MPEQFDHWNHSGRQCLCTIDLLTIVKGQNVTERRKDVATTVRELRGRRGWSLANLGGRAGLDPTTIWKIEHGKTPNPGSETLGKISYALGVEVSVLTGERPIPRRRAVVTEGVVVVPVMKLRVQADGQPTWDETREIATTLASLAAGRADRLIAAQVTGVCMRPHVNDGDTVIFDPEARSPQDGQMVIVTDGEGAMLVKWYRLDELGGPCLRAEDGTVLRPNGAKVIGTVIDISRKPIRDPQLAHPIRPTSDDPEA